MIVTSDGMQQAKELLEQRLGVPGYLGSLPHHCVGMIIEVDDNEFVVRSADVRDGVLHVHLDLLPVMKVNVSVEVP